METAGKDTVTANKNKTAEMLFTKEQLKRSQKFANRKDLLEILLEDGEQYPIAKVEQVITKFMKGDMK